VDLGSVKAAPTPVLIMGAIAAARNTQGLLYDARVLADAGCVPRAYSLAALAVEEAGKAASLVLLTVMPEAVRARAPVGRMLGWHQLKQVQGLVIARVPYSLPDVAPWLAAMPAGELAQFLTTLDVLADEADRLKRRGFYVDVGRGGRIREPSEITETEVLSQLARAGRAATAVGQLLQPELQTWLANPVAEAVELSRAVVSALTEARDARTPEAAAKVVLNAVSKLRARRAAKSTAATPVQGELRPRSTRHTQRGFAIAKP
jgi:AbiV family abortive infection protein